MAEVTIIPEITETVVKVVNPKQYVLTLSEKEASTLAMLTGAVSGSQTRSKRKYTQAVYNALSNAGVKYDVWSSVLRREPDRLWFENEENL